MQRLRSLPQPPHLEMISLTAPLPEEIAARRLCLLPLHSPLLALRNENKPHFRFKLWSAGEQGGSTPTKLVAVVLSIVALRRKRQPFASKLSQGVETLDAVSSTSGKKGSA